jgi:hypothetical protein
VLDGKAETAVETQAAAEGAEGGEGGDGKPKPKARPMVAKRSVPKPKA